MSRIAIQGVSHRFGEKHVLHDINLEIRAGQVVAVCGPSGCGKSTLLRALLGSHPPTAGQVLLDGKPVTGPCRDIGIIYQQYNLFDFLTARENVAFGPKVDQTTIPWRMMHPMKYRRLRGKHLADAQRQLNRVGLGECGDCYPSQLSGGQRQRVAIAQSLIMRPKVMLMDEPFGALDEANRERLQLMLLELYQQNILAKRAGVIPPHTVLIVTHELDEALYVSDRVIGITQHHADGAKGATVVYDHPSPVYRPTDPKDFSRFAAQKEAIRNLVFSPDRRSRTDKLIRLWNSADEFLPGNLSGERI